MSATETTAVVVLIQGPTGLTVDRPAVDAMYAAITKEIESFEYDLTTDAGRKRAASLAFGIAKKRTAIEADKKKLKEGLIVQGRAIDNAWNEIKEKLEKFQETARKPLTDWEAAEEKRKADCQVILKMLTDAVIVAATDTAERVASILSAVEDLAIDEAMFQDLHFAATSAKTSAVTSLKASLARIQQEEADRLELLKLRAEREARTEADRQATEAAEKERLRLEAEEREKVRATEAAETLRVAEENRKKREEAQIAAAKLEAETRVKREADEAARKEASRIEAEHQAELAKERKAREEVEAKQQAEAKRIAADKAAADLKANEEAKLTADKKNRTAKMTAAKVALMTECGLDEPTARKVVTEIVANKIVNITMRFV